MSLRKKKVQGVIALIIAMLIVLTGTFAWYSFNQRKTNEFNIKTPPNVNLHDDFEDGPEKDVYVENSGLRDVFVRVRLSEFMQIGLDSLVPGAIKDDPNTWTAHYPTADGTCYICNDNPNVEWFHTYYEWTMGGRKFYRPAEESAKGYGDPTDPTNEENPYKEPQVVGDTTDYAAKLRTAFDGNDAILALISKFTDYTQTFSDEEYKQLQEAIAGLKETAADTVIWTNPEDPEETMMLSQIQLTKTGANQVGTVGGDTDGNTNHLSPPMVISMQDWKDGKFYEPYAKGDFWVIDNDGWAYWANPLKPGEATGLLLSYVDRTEAYPADDAYYAINVWLQAVTAEDISRFGMQADMDGGGGISLDGLLMMSLGTGDFVYDDVEEKFYIDYGNNVYAELDTTSIETISAKVTKGDKFIGGPDGTPAGAVIEANKGLSINVADYSEGSAATTSYDLDDPTLSIETGRNGKAYLNLGDGSYAVSVEYKDGAPVDPYKILGLGEGYNETTQPFVQVWPGPDGVIGTGDDQYINEYVDLGDGILHHLGNGVFVKTSINGLGQYVDDLSTYYLTGMDKTTIGGLSDFAAFTGHEDVVALKQGDLFSFQPLSEGGTGFGAAGTPGDDDYTFEFAGMQMGTNGKWYILTEDVFTQAPYDGVENPQGENTLITINPNGKDGGKLGNDDGEDTNVLVWAKNPGTDDQFSRFSEPFLKGVKKEDLLPNGNGFTVDGANWVVLDVDADGNRLLLCDSLMGTKVTMGKSLYSQSNVKSEMQKIMATLTTINKYALPVEVPVWYRQITSAGGITATINRAAAHNLVTYNNTPAEYSKAKKVGDWSTTGAEGFALSLSEAVKYSELGRIPDCDGQYWWLRSAGKITGCGTKLYNNALGVNIGSGMSYQTSEPLANQICGTHDGLSFAKGNAKNSGSEQIYTMGAYTDSYLCRVAMWVRFSDADKLAKDIDDGKIPGLDAPKP